MTICIATNISSETIGGMAIFNNHFISLFTSFKHKVILLTVDPESSISLDDRIEIYNPYYSKVILRKSYYSELNKFKPYFSPGGCEAPRIIATGIAMRKWLQKNHESFGINVIEASDHGGFGIFLIDKNLPPVFITTHASNLQISKFNYSCFDEHGKVIKQLERISYENCNAIISHSPIISKEIRNLTSKPILTLPIPWEKKNIQKLDIKQYGLVIGQLQTLKGPIVLLKAINKAVKENNQLLIHWIGNDTHTMKGSLSISHYLKSHFPIIFNKHFVWIEGMSHERVLQQISEAAYIVIPSLWETFNYVALEAASMGKPIIITKGTGASYLFTNNIDALVIDSNDENELYRAVLKLHSDENLRVYLGKNAMNLVFEKFKSEKIVNKRILVYESVINKRQFESAELNELLIFLKKYLTIERKIYYSIRAFLKKLYLNLK